MMLSLLLSAVCALAPTSPDSIAVPPATFAAAGVTFTSSGGPGTVPLGGMISAQNNTRDAIHVSFELNGEEVGGGLLMPGECRDFDCPNDPGLAGLTLVGHAEGRGAGAWVIGG